MFRVAISELKESNRKTVDSNTLFELISTSKRRRKKIEVVKSYKDFKPVSTSDFKASTDYGRIKHDTTTGKQFMHKCWIVGMAGEFLFDD